MNANKVGFAARAKFKRDHAPRTLRQLQADAVAEDQARSAADWTISNYANIGMRYGRNWTRAEAMEEATRRNTESNGAFQIEVDEQNRCVSFRGPVRL